MLVGILERHSVVIESYIGSNKFQGPCTAYFNENAPNGAVYRRLSYELKKLNGTSIYMAGDMVARECQSIYTKPRKYLHHERKASKYVLANTGILSKK